MSDIIGLLTMCRRAGRLALGMEMTKDACANNQAAAVIVTRDVSPKTLKEVKFFCGRSQVKLLLIDEDMDYLGEKIGRRAGVIAVCDRGFAKKAAQILPEIKDDTRTDAKGDFDI